MHVRVQQEVAVVHARIGAHFLHLAALHHEGHAGGRAAYLAVIGHGAEGDGLLPYLPLLGAILKTESGVG